MTAKEDQALLQVQDFSFTSLDGVPSWRGISFALGPGEKVAIIGENGSGKSLLLAALLGLDTVTIAGGEAHYYLGDESGDGWDRMGYVAQNPEDNFLCLTVEEELLFGPRMRQWPEEAIEEASERISETFGLSGKGHLGIDRLSWGEKKILAVASSLILDPVLLLLDDPFGGLSGKYVEILTGVLKDYPGSLIVTCTHEEPVRPIVERILVLENGTLIEK